MQVTVVGATGNIGTSLLPALTASAEVEGIVGVARRPPDSEVGKVRWVAADFAVDDLEPAMSGSDALVHLGWLFQPTHNPEVTWKVNVEGAVRLFDAAVASGIRTIVYSSSVGAYSPAPPGRRVDEQWPTHSLPTAGYGREKAYVERVLDALEARHPEVRVVRMRPGFIFKRSSATEQRRLFMGPLAPGKLFRPGRLPVLPVPPNLEFQALHSQDAAEAFRLGLLGDARGAFNLAAEPVIDGRRLADVLGARLVEVPRVLFRAAAAAAWHAHLVPASPALLDLLLGAPLLDASRAERELGWRPRHSATSAVAEMFEGMAEGAGGDTAALEPDSVGGRVRELAGGVGERP